MGEEYPAALITQSRRCKSYCRKTMKKSSTYFRDVWYPKNRKKHIALVRASVKKVVAEIATLKDSPCTDCGGKFHPSAMEFDHVRGKKLGNISEMAARGSRRMALREIQKCEVVCANCHRVRTFNRRMAA